MNSQAIDDQWCQYLNFPDVEHGEKYASTEFDPQLPAFTNTQWAEFFMSCPPFEAYVPETLAGVTASNALQLYHIAAAPVASRASPSSSNDSHNTSSNYSDSVEFLSTTTNSGQIRPESKLRDSLCGPQLGPKRTMRHTPYAERDCKPAPTRESLQSWMKGPAPENAVFEHSSPQEIRAEMDRLSRLIRASGLSNSRHHPYMRCPVYDCPKGGYNALLHGEPPNSSPDSPSSGFSQTTTDAFFTKNEIARHVRSVHTPDMDLRCDAPGCERQSKLDTQAGGYGRGRFSREDLFRRHLKECPSHKASVPEELRMKYKLWRKGCIA